MLVSPNEVLLVRHGETDDNAADRFQGRIDTPLNDRGREQSRALATQLAGSGLRAMYASPLSRARETTAIVGRRIGLAAVFVERLMVAAVRTGPLQGTGGEVLNCELHRLPVPAASIA